MQRSTLRTAPTGADLPDITRGPTPSCSIEQFFDVLGHRVPHVDHRNPIHDGYCRCTTCRPAAIGTTSQSLLRVHVALATGAIAALVVGVARAGGL